MIRLAGALALFAGIGFGLPGVVGTRHFAKTGSVWMLMGFPTYGDGPFTGAGIATTVPLLVGFVIVCIAEVVVGVLLMLGWRPAVLIQFALLPLELAYWWGFALPFGFLFGIARVVVGAWALLTQIHAGATAV